MDDAGEPIPNLLEVPADAEPVLVRNDVLNDMVLLDYLPEDERDVILEEPVYVEVPEVPECPHEVAAAGTRTFCASSTRRFE